MTDSEKIDILLQDYSYEILAGDYSYGQPSTVRVIGSALLGLEEQMTDEQRIEFNRLGHWSCQLSIAAARNQLMRVYAEVLKDRLPPTDLPPQTSWEKRKAKSTPKTGGAA